MHENARHGEEYDFRFVCVGATAEELAKDISARPFLSRLRRFRFKIHYVKVSTPAAVMIDEIVKLVLATWQSTSFPKVLGATVKDSLFDLLRLFTEYDTHTSGFVLQLDLSDAATLNSVLYSALSSRTLGSGIGDDSVLLNKIVTLGSGLRSYEKRRAVDAFHRKWERSWSWGWSSRERDELIVIGSLPSGIQATAAQAASRPTGFVPKNPTGVLLDYEIPTTEEGRLKRALLEDDYAASGVNGAANATNRSSYLAAVSGMSGVGKTCALRGLGYLDDIWRRFANGIFFLSLGQDASASGVLLFVADVVEYLGNNVRAREIRGCSAVSDAVRRAGIELRGLSCLFLVDDVWPTPSSSAGHLEDLEHLVDSCERSRIVFSTMDKRIARRAGGCVVSFGVRSEMVSRRMLLSYAGFDESEVDSLTTEATESLQYALDICGGLPVSLAATGRLVEREAQHLPKEAPRGDAWSIYKSSAEQYHALCEGTHHRGLSVAFRQCLDEVERRLSSFSVEYKHSAAAMYRALSVLQKKAWAPYSMLCALWSLDVGSNKVKRVVYEFEALSVLEIEVRGVNGAQKHGVRLHDLALEFCQQQVRAHESESEAKWHRALLRGYLPGQIPRKSMIDLLRSTLFWSQCTSPCRPWWSLPDDWYLYAHLTGHLLGCHEFDETVSLLLDYRWISAQLRRNGFRNLLQDYELVIKSLRASQSHVRSVSAIELVNIAMRESWPGISRDSHRVPFQLSARLKRFESENQFVAQLLESVEKHAPRPWVRPLSLSLSAVRPTWLSMMSAECKMPAITFILKATEPLTAELINNHSTVVDDQFQLTGRGARTRAKIDLGIVDMCLTRAATVVVSSGDDGRACFWDVETGVETSVFNLQQQILMSGRLEVKAVTGGRLDMLMSSSIAEGSGTRNLERKKEGEELAFIVSGRPKEVKTVSRSTNWRRAAAATENKELWFWELKLSGTNSTSAVQRALDDDSVWPIVMAANGETVVSEVPFCWSKVFEKKVCVLYIMQYYSHLLK